MTCTIVAVISTDDMQHAEDWNGEDVTGWYGSEKMHGVRGYFDAEAMWSKSGRKFPIPELWHQLLPKIHIEGEVWGGRANFPDALRAVVHNQWAAHVAFLVFDAPRLQGDWAERIRQVAPMLEGCGVAQPVPWAVIRDMEHVREWVRLVRLAGGEGLILRRPGVEYRCGRSRCVLKLKKDPVTGELAWRGPRIFRRSRSAPRCKLKPGSLPGVPKRRPI